mgnify:CR=1 FL=1
MRMNRWIAGILVAVMGLPVMPAQAGERRIRCESGRNGRYRECRVDTDNRVDLVRVVGVGRERVFVSERSVDGWGPA